MAERAQARPQGPHSEADWRPYDDWELEEGRRRRLTAAELSRERAIAPYRGAVGLSLVSAVADGRTASR